MRFEHDATTPAQIARARRLRADMKPPERSLWCELRKLDAHIRRQAPIGPYVTDFACPAKKLVIEVDGEVHERLPDVALRDHERAECLRAQGYRVARFTNRQVHADLYGVVEAVKVLLGLRAGEDGDRA